MTPHAVLLGLMGEDPESVEVGRLGRIMDEVRDVGEVDLGGVRVRFDLNRDLVCAFALRARKRGLMKDVDMASESTSGSSEWVTIHRLRQEGRYDGYQ